MPITLRLSASLRTSLFLAALISTAFACPAHAADAPAAAQTQAALAPEGQFIQDLGSRAVSILADKTITPDKREAKFRDMLQTAFDMPTIARFVIGRTWMNSTDAQRDEYLNLFETLVVKTYSDRFKLYTGEGFKVSDSRPEGTKDFIVNSNITHPDGSQPTVVSWRVRQKDGKYGIIDVVVEGVSMSVTQRQEYSSVIQRNGGDIEALLTMMRDRAKAGAGLSEKAAQ